MLSGSVPHFLTTLNYRMIKERANNHDLSKPLDEKLLSSLSLDDLKTLKRILIERAAAVLGEIGELKAFDEFEKHQYRARMYRSEIKLESGQTVFNYSPEPRFADMNFFVPGEWFAELLAELDALREKKRENAETFEDRHKNILIGELVGASRGKAAGK